MKNILKFSIFLFIFGAVLFSASFSLAQQYYTGLCISHSYQRCAGNYLAWYDSCGNQQDSQYCANGCYNNSCQYDNYNYNYNYNYYGNCTYHAYKLCAGNNIYWYDSCGNQQDLFQTCYGANMMCKYGQCVYQQPYIPPYIPVLPPQNPYIIHYKTACYAGNIYWYDSLGTSTGLYKNCADANSCTQDSCGAGKCSNVLKCDGTTCAAGSADYNTYCATNNNNGNGNNNAGVSALSISFFAKASKTSAQWEKTVQVGQNGQVYFMISVLNNSGSEVGNVTVLTNIPNEITSLGNLQVNGVAVSGDIVSGINVGSLAPGTSKSITFEGKTQTFSTQEIKQAIATSNVSGNMQTDSLSIDFRPNQTAGASVSAAQSSSGFLAFLKRWYLWILVGLVLIFLFVVVFRRLSSAD